MLVTALVTQIQGVGDMKGTTLSWFRFWDCNGPIQAQFLFIIKKD